jgi:uncharacterized protein (DUF488 family)
MYTLGYEGASLDEILEVVRRFNITAVADVRQLPLSRKAGFSKSAFSQALSINGVHYRHFRALGDPKSGREAARKKRYAEFERIFLMHLCTPEAQNGMTTLLDFATFETVCLLCFERCSQLCHRSYIADHASSQGFDVFDLSTDLLSSKTGDAKIVPRYYPR